MAGIIDSAEMYIEPYNSTKLSTDQLNRIDVMPDVPEDLGIPFNDLTLRYSYIHKLSTKYS